LRHLYIWERILLLGGAITLIIPGLLTDLVGCGTLLIVYILQKCFPFDPKAGETALVA
jgi:UPF0716 family protein affecting phage T7 exclusion